MTTRRVAPSTDFRRQAILQIPPRAPRAGSGDLPEDRCGIGSSGVSGIARRGEGGRVVVDQQEHSSAAVTEHPAKPMNSPTISRIFHEALVDCMAHARPPSTEELEAMAARIWNDMRGDSPLPPWHDVVPGSPDHSRMRCAARAALGVVSGEGAQDSCGPVSWQQRKIV